MNAGEAAEASAPSDPPPRRAGRRLLGFVLGILMLAGAAWVVYRQRSDLAGAWTSIRAAPVWLALLALLLPLANWLLIAASFWVLMRRHGRIGFREMVAAIGGAWLLNYLPLRAGMIGRVAYHKAVNRIAVTDSIRVMVWNVALGALAIAAVLGIVVGPGLRPHDPRLIAVLAAVVPMLVGVRFLLVRRGAAWVADVLLLRYLDMMVWVARYAVVFAIVGAPITLGGAVAVAVACQAALLVPFIGNGLGIREWAVGITASMLPPALLSSSGELTTATGLLADVVNRAAELVVAVPVGQLSLAYLGRKVRASRAGAANSG